MRIVRNETVAIFQNYFQYHLQQYLFRLGVLNKGYNTQQTSLLKMLFKHCLNSFTVSSVHVF